MTGRVLQADATPLQRATRSAETGRPWWPWLRRALTIGFFALLAVLLVRQARAIEWDDVWATMVALPADVLLLAAALALASHLLYACFDLLGRHVTGHTLPTRRVMAVTFISYAFNLNMGSLVGGVASRFRLYGRLGLDTPTVARVLLFSMLTNWIGYLLLGGVALLFFPLPLPAQWDVDPAWLQAAGAVLVGLAVTYLALCGLAPGRRFLVRGHGITLPGLRLALLQLAMSCANWLLMGGVVYVLAQQQLPYTTLLAVLLLAAIAGVITHVPAGLGVLEAVFVALLGTLVAPASLVGMLLAYRALYYLVPLAIAVVLFATLEARHKTEGTAPR